VHTVRQRAHLILRPDTPLDPDVKDEFGCRGLDGWMAALAGDG